MMADSIIIQDVEFENYYHSFAYFHHLDIQAHQSHIKYRQLSIQPLILAFTLILSLHFVSTKKTRLNLHKLLSKMLKLFGFSHHKDEHEPDQPTLLAPATPAERKPPPAPQGRQSRLGTSYEKPAQKKKEVPKPVNITHESKSKLPASNPTRVSRLGSKFEERVPAPSNSSSYETMESTDNPIVAFMLSCVTCDDETKQEPAPVAVNEME
jgi:hypothetical protein